MNQETTIAIGTPMGGGFFAGKINVDGKIGSIIVAPKADGECKEVEWHNSYGNVEGALSLYDGLANTRAMAAAGSKIAQCVLALRIDEHDDWHIPAQDVLEIIYRNLKPTTETNSPWGRSGINVSAVPPTYPYTPNLPAQTSVDAFKEGGEQAFDDTAYWTSTQHAGHSGCAWFQYFNNGGQHDYSRKGNEFAVRAVRISF